MTRFFLFFAFFSLQAFAGTPVLTKHATSGYVLPEHRFTKDCKILREGFVEFIHKSGDGTIMGFTHSVPSYRIFEIRQLVRVARKGAIIDDGVMCDGGSENVTGFYAGKEVMIKDVKDCFSSQHRAGWAARRLRRIATEICTF